MEEPSRAQEVIRGTATVVATVFASFAVGYLLTVGIAWLLPAEAYGALSVALATLMMLNVLVSAGFPTAVTRFLAGDSRFEVRLRYLKSCFVGTTLGAVVVALGFGLFAAFADSRMYSSTVILLLLGAPFLFGLRTLYTRALQGLLRINEMVLASLLEVLVRLVLGIGLVALGYGVAGVMGAWLVGAALALGLMAARLRRYRFWKARGWAVREVVSFSGGLFVSIAAFTIFWNVDVVAARLLSHEEEVTTLLGYYQGALNWARLVFFLVQALATALFPFLVQAGSQPVPLASVALKYTMLVVVPVCVGLAVLPAPFLTLILPAEYANGATFLRIAALGGGVLGLLSLYMSFMDAQGRAWVSASALVAALGLQVLLLLVLVPRIGVLGAPVSTAAAGAVALAVLIIKYHPGALLKKMVARGVLIFVAFAPPLGLLFIAAQHGRIGLLGGILGGGLIYLVMLRLVRLLTARDREVLRHLLPNKGRLGHVADLITSLLGPGRGTEAGSHDSPT